MIEIKAQVLDNKNIKLSSKNFGNKYDNSIRKVIFNSIDESANLNNKYVAFLNPSSDIFLFPLNSEDNSFIVTSTITKQAGTWKMIYLATNTAIVDGVIDYGYKVFVSNAVDFTITENFLTDAIEEPIIDENLAIIYEKLDQTIIYLNSKEFKEELMEYFYLSDENIETIAENLKKDTEFQEIIKGEDGTDGKSLYEEWLNQNTYSLNERLGIDSKFYINRDILEYLKVFYSGTFYFCLVSTNNYKWILDVQYNNVSLVKQDSSEKVIRGYSEEQLLLDGIPFNEDDFITSIVDLSSVLSTTNLRDNLLLKEKYLDVEEYNKLFAVGIYDSWLDLYSYKAPNYIHPANIYYWNKDVVRDIKSKGIYYDNRIILQTDVTTITFNHTELVFDVYSTEDLTSRIDTIDIAELLNTEDAYITLMDSNQIIRMEEHLLLKTPWISIEDYSSTYLKGEKGEAFTYEDFTEEQLEALKGKDGKSAYQSWLDLGNTGTEQEFLDSLNGTDGKDGQDGSNGKDGTDGKDGKSAYQTWLDLGNTGTEQEFLDSLKGADGQDGSNGTDGTDGEDGYTPVRGTDYWTEEDIQAMKDYCKSYIDTDILGGAS